MSKLDGGLALVQVEWSTGGGDGSPPCTFLEEAEKRMSNPGPELLRQIMQRAQQDGAVRQLWVGGTALVSPDEPFLELQIILGAPRLPDWLWALGDPLLRRMREGELQLVTKDGLDIAIRCVGAGETPDPAKFRAVITKPETVAAPAGSGESVPPGPAVQTRLTELAAAFWGDLYRACAAIGRGLPFTAHGELERCRGHLLALYRLAAGAPAQGEWAGFEPHLEAQPRLELAEWLVAPLQIQAQWRNGYRLAQRFESLLLPLVERLGLPFPWGMRNLAFERLQAVKPTVQTDGPDHRA
jgi:hypothetical protein